MTNEQLALILSQQEQLATEMWYEILRGLDLAFEEKRLTKNERVAICSTFNQYKTNLVEGAKKLRSPNA